MEKANSISKQRSSEVPPGHHWLVPLGISWFFVRMRYFEPPCLHQNQMASCIETLCVIIAGPALGFLHTRKNLLPFTKDFRAEDQLDEYIRSFSQVLLRPQSFHVRYLVDACVIHVFIFYRFNENAALIR